MSNIVRNGDTNTAGGAAIGGATSVFAEGSNVMLPNQPVTPHPCCGSSGCESHCQARTTGGSSSVFAEGAGIVHVNNIDTCGHKRGTAAGTVYVGL